MESKANAKNKKSGKPLAVLLKELEELKVIVRECEKAMELAENNVHAKASEIDDFMENCSHEVLTRTQGYSNCWNCNSCRKQLTVI